MEASRDKDLLIGVFAVQIRGIPPHRVAEAVSAWEADPEKPLGRHLVDRGLITEQDLDALARVTNESIQAHGGSAAGVLALFGGEDHVRRVFFGGATSSYLDHVDTAPITGGNPAFSDGRGISGVEETPGRYTLVSHHARGGMGRVLIVHDEYLGRNIALKELMPPSAPGTDPDKPTPIRQSASMIARFLQEARITSQLEHPAIVPVYELGRRQDGTLYYTMRLVRGKTFAAALRECEGLEDRLRLLSSFISLCNAIAYAHSHGIIHRDIKPANVMLGQFGETVVLDWGLAKLRDARDVHVEDIREALESLELEGDNPLPMTAYGRALGTPHYMPPEQAGGQIDSIDERSDVYSLGAVLYEILTGTTPHSGKNTRDIIEKVLHAQPTPVLAATPDAPPQLAVICEKALQRDSAKRYQTAAGLADDVERFIQGSLVSAYRYSLGQILAHYYSRHRALVNTAAACLLLLAIMGTVSYASILQARNREHAQRLAAEAAQASEARARGVAERKTYQTQIHLAQAHLAGRETVRADEALWETAPHDRGWEWGFLLNRANPEIYSVTVAKSSLYSIVFSPDGTRIGTRTSPAPPALYEAATGRKLMDFESEPLFYMQTLFSPDGTLYAGAAREGVLNVWETASGRRRLRVEQRSACTCAAFSQDGTRLFAGYNDATIRVYDPVSGAVAFEWKVEGNPESLLPVPGSDRLWVSLDNGSIMVWDLTNQTPVATMRGGEFTLGADGKRVAVTQTTEMVLCDALTGAEEVRLKGHVDTIHSLTFNRDGSLALSASSDRTVILWDTKTGRALNHYSIGNGAVPEQAFFLAGDSTLLVRTTEDDCLVYAGTLDHPAYSFQGKGKLGTMSAMQPGTNMVVLVSDENSFQAVNPLAPTGMHYVTPPAANSQSMGLLAASSGKDLLAVTNPESCITLVVNPEAGKRLCSHASSFGQPVRDVSVSVDGKQLALIADRYVPVVMTDPAGTPSLTAFTGHQARINVLALQRSGVRAASGDDRGGVFLWNTDSGRAVRTLSAEGSGVSAMAFSPNDRLLAVARKDGSLSVTDVDTGTMVQTLPRQPRPVAAVAYSNDATKMITVDTSGLVQLWNAATSALQGSLGLGELQASDEDIIEGNWVSCRFWPGDRLFYVRFPYTRPKLWDTATLEPVLFFSEDEVVAPMNDGGVLATLNRAGSVRVDDIPRDNAMTTPETYSRYRAQWAPRIALDTAELTPFHVFISREDLARMLNDTAERGFEDRRGDATCLAVAGDRFTQSMFAARLQPGDAVRAVNGRSFTGGADAKTVLAETAQTLSGPNMSACALTMDRGGHPLDMVFWTLPLAREEQTIAVTRKEALELIQLELNHARTRAAVPNKKAWMDIFFNADRSTGKKLPIPEELTCLAEVDGVPFTDSPALEALLNPLRQRIEEGGSFQFSQCFRMGALRERVYVYTVGAD